MKLEGKRRAVKVYHCNPKKPQRKREGIVNLTLNAPEEILPEISSLGTDTNLKAEQLLKKTEGTDDE